MAQPGSNPMPEIGGREATTGAPLDPGGAFERTYFDHAPLMRRVAKRRFGIPDSEADALVHDIFATWLANPSVVRGNLRAYFLGAVWNAARQYHRKYDRSSRSLGSCPCSAPSAAKRCAASTWRTRRVPISPPRSAVRAMGSINSSRPAASRPGHCSATSPEGASHDALLRRRARSFPRERGG